MNFWGKTTENGQPGISAFEHMINVGCVARCLAEIVPELLKLFDLFASTVGALVALHDLGKISPGFQQKCEQWLIANNLAAVAKNGNWLGGTETDHGRASHAAIPDALLELGCSRNVAMHIATILGAHHGRIKFRPDPRGIRSPMIAPLSEERSGIDWKAERLRCARETWEYFGVQKAPENLTGDAAAIWWLAGLTTVADWIGSDERFFSPTDGGKQSDPPACAKEAISAIGFIPPTIVPGLAF